MIPSCFFDHSCVAKHKNIVKIPLKIQAINSRSREKRLLKSAVIK
jgi:hypothetical protein